MASVADGRLIAGVRARRSLSRVMQLSRRRTSSARGCESGSAGIEQVNRSSRSKGAEAQTATSSTKEEAIRCGPQDQECPDPGRRDSVPGGRAGAERVC
ncbi:MAG TPA: hypothetical protein VHJ59_06600, partial [Nitrososphaera sp.]|nr:hypothetical protein [Nitrososphaera sp.]